MLDLKKLLGLAVIFVPLLIYQNCSESQFAQLVESELHSDDQRRQSDSEVPVNAEDPPVKNNPEVISVKCPADIGSNNLASNCSISVPVSPVGTTHNQNCGTQSKVYTKNCENTAGKQITTYGKQSEKGEMGISASCQANGTWSFSNTSSGTTCTDKDSLYDCYLFNDFANDGEILQAAKSIINDLGNSYQHTNSCCSKKVILKNCYMMDGKTGRTSCQAYCL